MALVFHAQGEHGKALEYNARALAICEEVLGLEHPNTATTYNNMAMLFEEQGKHDEAFEFYLCALKARRATLPEGHHYTRQSYESLKSLYHKMNAGKSEADFESWLVRQLQQ